MSGAALRTRAETLSRRLPPLLAEAERLAATIQTGAHGRRQPGAGDEFWQYRAALPGDPVRRIDWRRSARADATFVRETEWQATQTVSLWCDMGRSMRFGEPSKAERARLLALSLAVLLVRAGERVGTFDPRVPAGTGRQHLERISEAFDEADAEGDHDAPGAGRIPPHSRAVFLSDFMGDPAPVERVLTRSAARGVRGILYQVLAPEEQDFPYDGRTIFESMAGATRHETLKAGDLRTRYKDRLAERQERLRTLAARTGWRFRTHVVEGPATPALLWLHRAVEGAR